MLIPIYLLRRYLCQIQRAWTGMMGFCCLFAERDEETRSLLVLDVKTFSEIGRRNMDFRSAFEFHGMHVPAG